MDGRDGFMDSLHKHGKWVWESVEKEKRQRKDSPSVKTEINSSTQYPCLSWSHLNASSLLKSLFHPRQQLHKNMVCFFLYLFPCISIECDPCLVTLWCTVCCKTRSPSGHSWCVYSRASKIPSSCCLIWANVFDFICFWPTTWGQRKGREELEAVHIRTQSDHS